MSLYYAFIIQIRKFRLLLCQVLKMCESQGEGEVKEEAGGVNSLHVDRQIINTWGDASLSQLIPLTSTN